MMKQLIRCALFASLLGSPATYAALLHLSNGESISGALEGGADGKLDWQSAILGELSVDQGHIKSVETEQRFEFKLNGSTLHQCWMYVDRGKQLLHCNEGVIPLFYWKLVIAAGEPEQYVPPHLSQRGDIKLAIEASNGNTNLEKYDLDGNLELRYANSRHAFLLRYVEENARGTTTQNRWRSTQRDDQFLTDQWFLAGNAFYEEDEVKDLDSRTSVGLGGGYQFLDTDFIELVGTATVNYVDEKFSEGDGRRTPALLWNTRFRWQFTNEGLEFFHRNAILQAFDSSGDYELDTSTGLKYPIMGSLSSVMQFDYSYDNTPGDNAGKTDRKWSIGMNYQW